MIRVSIPSYHKVVEDNNDSYTVNRTLSLVFNTYISFYLFLPKAGAYMRKNNDSATALKRDIVKWKTPIAYIVWSLSLYAYILFHAISYNIF